MIPLPVRDPIPPPVTPPGYRENAAGLLVPEPLSRVREVWTRDEERLISRAMGLLQQHGIMTTMKCAEPDCTDRDIVASSDVENSRVMVCGCKRRIFTRSL